MGDLKKDIEAVLFSAGRIVSLKELLKILKVNDEDKVREAAEELKQDYDSRNSPTMIVEEKDGWKLTVREPYLPVVHSINPHTELSKSILETLAVIAWKQPVLQSDVIKVRTNKAYDHINELESLGFINKKKHGRTYVLRVTQKFRDYFDLPDDKSVKELFRGFKDIEVAVREKSDKFEKDIPEEDKELLESRTPQELEMIASEVEQEELGMETYSDVLSPVRFPHDQTKVEVYTSGRGEKGDEKKGKTDEQSEETEKSDTEGRPSAEKGPEGSSGDTVEEKTGEGEKKEAEEEKEEAEKAVGAEAKSSEKGPGEEESESEKARRLAKQLLQEPGESEEEAGGSEGSGGRDLHPELEGFIQGEEGEEKESRKSEEKITGEKSAQEVSESENSGSEKPEEAEGAEKETEAERPGPGHKKPETPEAATGISDEQSVEGSSEKEKEGPAPESPEPAPSRKSGSEQLPGVDKKKELPAESFPGEFSGSSEEENDSKNSDKSEQSVGSEEKSVEPEGSSDRSDEEPAYKVE